MDSEAYHFDKDDINLTQTNKTDREVYAIIENHEGNDHETLNYVNEFQSNNDETFNELTTQEINAKSKSSINLVNNIEISGPTCCQTVEQSQTLGNEKETKKTAKNEALSSHEDEPYRGSARLVRLQAVSEPCSNVRSDAQSTIISEGDSTAEIYTHESKIEEESDNHHVVFSEEEVKFLSPPMTSVNQEIYLSTNSEENVLISEVSYQAVMQNEDQNTELVPNSRFEQSVFLTPDKSVSDITIAKIEGAQSFTDSTASLWIVNSSGDNNGTSGMASDHTALQYHENLQTPSSDYQSSASLDETQQMQRFITSDNQVVYGYKEPNGEFHFFCSAMNDRESHNEKERKRRSRVSDACSSLRKMIPGMSEKTDKATAFEQAARYLKFLRDKFGTQFDQAYSEKYFKKRS